MFAIVPVAQAEVSHAERNGHQNGTITKQTAFGRVTLSLAAGEGAYCSPRIDGLPFTQYESYEVALFVNQRMNHPINFLSLHPFVDLWESADAGGCVAGWVARDTVVEMIKVISEMP